MMPPLPAAQPLILKQIICRNIMGGPRLDDSSAHSEVSGGRSSSSRSKSKRTQLLLQHKSASTSAIDSSSRKSKSKSKSNRRQSIDNSTSSGSRSSSSRRLKEKSSQQQQTKELLVKQHSRGSLDSNISDYRKSTTSHQRVGTNDRMDRGVILEELEGGIPPPLHQSTNSTTSRFSTNPYRRPSQDLPTPTRSNNSITTNNNKAPSVVVHACDDKGRCIFHPHIQLRKKSIMGLIGGWKDILHACPDCEKQELQELLLREKEEITKLELMLGRLDQHDVEYLNDDGVDDDGNYLPFSSAAGPANSSVGREEHLGGKKVVQITFGEGCRLPVMKRRSSV